MIFIANFPRTGSSMTAGIFAKHGVWVGDYRKGDEINKKGHFENKLFKQLIRGKYRVADPGPFHENWAIVERILELNPPEPWLIKGYVMFWPIFDPLTPKYVCVRRNKESVLDSCKATGLHNSGCDSQLFDRYSEEMDFLVETRSAVNVYTDKVIKGDYSSLERAFEHCNVRFNEEIAEDFIEKSLWHY